MKLKQYQRLNLFIQVSLWVILFNANCFAQLVVNNGIIGITNNGLVRVGGSVLNADTLSNLGAFHIDSNFTNNGHTLGGGTIHLQGDFENNMIFSADTSTVILEGNNQVIRGDSITEFHHLTLTGTGVKSLELNAASVGTLALNDRELATDTNTFFVRNTSLTAITNNASTSSDSGFVSSSNGGYLARKMQGSAPYFFPLGSTTAGHVYRPIRITPSTSSNNEFWVRLAKVDASIEGYDITQVDSTLCTINPAYYHQIRRTEGTDLVTLEMFYDNVIDFDANTIAQWQSTGEWANIGPVSDTSNAAPTLSIKAKLAWNNFNERAFALASSNIQTATSSIDVACIGISTGTASVNTTGGNPPYAYQWGGAAAGQTAAIVTGLPSGVYPVTITDNFGCSKLDSITVMDLGLGPVANAGLDTTIASGGTAMLQGLGGGDYYWTPEVDLNDETLQNPTALPIQTTTYTLVVTDSLGCSDTSYVTVTVDFNVNVGVPNVFSPNGDSQNDFVYVHGPSYGLDNVNFVVFDRWGEKVFESDCCCSESCGWDGTYNGEKMNGGVFVYVLTASVNGEQVKKHGNITLIRN